MAKNTMVEVGLMQFKERIAGKDDKSGVINAFLSGSSISVVLM